jgi:hypothetical protein
MMDTNRTHFPSWYGNVSISVHNRSAKGDCGPVAYPYRSTGVHDFPADSRRTGSNSVAAAENLGSKRHSTFWMECAA